MPPHPSNKKAKPTPLTWSDIEAWSASKKKEWLITQFPEEIRLIAKKMIEESSLEYNGLMIPTLLLYAHLSHQIYKQSKQSACLCSKQFEEVQVQLKELKQQNEALIKALQVMANRPCRWSLSRKWITKKITAFKQRNK